MTQEEADAAVADGSYNAFAGNAVDNIYVKFVNQASGEVIQEANARDMNG